MPYRSTKAMYASPSTQVGHEEPHPTTGSLSFPAVVPGSGPKRYRQGGKCLTWSVACDLSEAREGACAERIDAGQRKNYCEITCYIIIIKVLLYPDLCVLSVRGS